MATRAHVPGSAQISEMAFDFAEGLVVGLGIQPEEKGELMHKWKEFSANAITYIVRCRSHPPYTFCASGRRVAPVLCLALPEVPPYMPSNCRMSRARAAASGAPAT